MRETRCAPDHAAPCRAHSTSSEAQVLAFGFEPQRNQRRRRMLHCAPQSEPGIKRDAPRRGGRGIAQIHRDQPEAAAGGQQVSRFERLGGIVPAADPQHAVKLHSRRFGRGGVEGVVGIHQRAGFLPLCGCRHHRHEQAGSAGGCRSDDLSQASARQSADGAVDFGNAGGDRFHRGACLPIERAAERGFELPFESRGAHVSLFIRLSRFLQKMGTGVKTETYITDVQPGFWRTSPRLQPFSPSTSKASPPRRRDRKFGAGCDDLGTQFPLWKVLRVKRHGNAAFPVSAHAQKGLSAGSAETSSTTGASMNSASSRRRLTMLPIRSRRTPSRPITCLYSSRISSETSQTNVSSHPVPTVSRWDSAAFDLRFKSGDAGY